MPTLVLQPDSSTDKDLLIREPNPGGSYGGHTQIGAGNASSVQSDRSLIQFDLSSITSRLGLAVTSATLKLWCEAESISTDLPIYLHRSLVEWFEGTTGGGGAPGGGEDATTWNHRNTNGSIAWSGGAGGGAGSDYATTATTNTVITGISAYFNFDVSVDVFAFVTNVSTNYGWFLIGDESNTISRKMFSSANHATSAQRPELTVNYTTGNTIAGTSTLTGTLTNANAGVNLVEIQPTETAAQDTHINSFSTHQNRNFGVYHQLRVGEATGFTSHITRTLIKFDLSSIPDDATILSATLSLYATVDLATTGSTFRVYRLKRVWLEGTRADTEDSPATGATWVRYNTTSNWQTAGAFGVDDCEQTDIGSRSFTATEALNEFKHFPLVGATKADLDLGNGWLIKADTELNDSYSFASSSDATAALRPKLTVTYTVNDIQATVPGLSVVLAAITAPGYLRGDISGNVSLSAFLLTNEYFHVFVDGLSTLEATGTLKGYARSSFAAAASVSGTMRAEGTLVATLVSIGTAVGDIQGEIEIVANISGLSTVFALPDFAGHLRSVFAGTSSVIGLMWGKATGKAVAVICDPMPLLYLTDGTVKTNGQKNLINFLSKEAGFLLKDWRPQIAQYKEGGRFSNGPLAQGRRLRYRNFENIIDVYELSASGHNQDALIEYQHELLAFQEAAADYWVSDYVSNPVYLVAKAARETYERYAIVHMISVPELTNPYSQPFYGRGHPTMETLTIRIEHGHWLSTAPGDFESVEISSIRSWTVSGWETGS